MHRILLAIFVVALLLTPIAAQTEKEAQASAEAWVKLVDDHKYAESWTEASSLFRSQVSQEKWIEMLGAVREPLGLVESRILLTVTLTKSLPGAPDGDYAVVQFQTAFKNKPKAVETVTLMFEDSRWRAAGYFIK